MGEGSEPPSNETMVQRFRDPNKEIASVNNKENIKKTREVVTSSLDTVKLYGSKYYIERL